MERKSRAVKNTTRGNTTKDASLKLKVMGGQVSSRGSVTETVSATWETTPIPRVTMGRTRKEWEPKTKEDSKDHRNEKKRTNSTIVARKDTLTSTTRIKLEASLRKVRIKKKKVRNNQSFPRRVRISPKKKEKERVREPTKRKKKK